MQAITNLSKYLFLALLSCGFLLTLNGVHNSQTDMNIITNEPELAPEITVPVTKQKAHSAKAHKPENNAAPIIAKTKSKPAQTHKPSIWHSISSNFTLDHKASNKRVRREIKRLLSNQHKLKKILTQAGPYIYYIFQQTKAHGLPAELALIPYIESEYNPNDHSSVGALGLWQLMPRTARELGVRIRGGYDGRRNVISSTKAAMAYFKDLGKMFKGNWYLAMAAYNAGQGKVSSVARRAHSRDFFKLPLPRETQYYVPRLLAIAEIVQHPKKYGVTLPNIENKQFFKQVNLKKGTSLRNVAKKSGVDVKTLNKLNPDLKRVGYVVKQKDGKHTVLLPVTHAEAKIV